MTLELLHSLKKCAVNDSKPGSGAGHEHRLYGNELMKHKVLLEH